MALRTLHRCLGGWRPQLLCVAILVAELGTALSTHRSDAELARIWETAGVQERIEALHALANRPDALSIDAAFVARLLEEPHERLRAMAMTVSLTRHGVGGLRTRFLSELFERDFEQWWRLHLLLRAKVGGAPLLGGPRLTLRELEWFEASFEHPLPRERVVEHARARLAGEGADD